MLGDSSCDSSRPSAVVFRSSFVATIETCADTFIHGTRIGQSSSIAIATVYMTVAGARGFQGTRPQSLYIKDQPSWPIYVSNCIYETYDLAVTYIGSAELNDSWRRFPNRCRAATVFNGRTTVSKTVVLYTVLLCLKNE
jgi:hypothetical protein